jgi:hypothetical protein
MANTRTLNRSFAGGEISREMYGRIDDVKYQSGAALLENFIATPQGPAENRPGFAYVNSTKNNAVARLIPFTFSPTQTMVIEIGEGYFRFHTDGETLLYTPGANLDWVPPSGAITISLSTPAIVTWTGHGLSTGDPILFYLYGGTTLADLPPGLQTGHVYTVQKIDADTFTLLDNGVSVGLSASGGAGTTTTYTGSGTTTAQAGAGPGETNSSISSVLSGLASAVPASGFVNLSVDVNWDIETEGRGRGVIEFQYSTGSGWTTFLGAGSNSGAQTVSVQIPVSNIDLIQLRVEVTAIAPSGTGPYFTSSSDVTGNITAWSVDVTTSGGGSTTFGGVRGYRSYSAGDMVKYGGLSYSAAVSGSGGLVTPGTDATVWHLLPASEIYEVGNSYLEADLFEIHYVQSADVITLTHPNYPPSELRRLSASSWSFGSIQFGEVLAAPLLVGITASPGYLAKLTTTDSATPSKLTTQANHTLAMGDGVYATDVIVGGVTKSDFYLVAKVPVDGTGALIPTQLYLVDYSGNDVQITGFGSNPSLQYGGKIFDITNHYVVTAMSADGVNESPVSAEVSVLNNLNVTGSFNSITWQTVANAARYRVYKKKNGLFGYIGETTESTFNDNNIGPDFSITPPIYDQVFASAGNYPKAVGYFDQRRSFAGTNNNPQDVWMSKSGTESDFSYSLPVKDNDRIYFRVASREANPIEHIIPLTQLLLLTTSTEVRVSPVNSDALTPSDISTKPQSYIGASSVQPSIINNSLVYCAARGGHVRELGYQWQANGFVTGDLSLRAAHLFDNLTIVDQCFSKCPRPIVWFVSSNGDLLGLTYIPEEQVGAWHHHNTDGFFESITAVAEGNEDRLYAVIRRTVNGNTVRYVERMASRVIDEDDYATWFFVDSGSTYNGAPATVISGLDWLEGKTVAILADGAVCPQQPVSGGSITLEKSASIVHVGLPYNSDLQTLPLMLQIDGFGQGRTKNINNVWVRVYQSGGVSAGPDADHLIESKQRTTEPYGTPPSLASAEIQITTTPSWKDSGQIFLRQKYPLPLSVTGICMEVSIGG